jgi:hypothetical protein
MGRGDFSRPDFGRLKPPLPETDKDEIAPPFGFAMTVTIVISFVLV